MIIKLFSNLLYVYSLSYVVGIGEVNSFSGVRVKLVLGFV